MLSCSLQQYIPDIPHVLENESRLLRYAQLDIVVLNRNGAIKWQNENTNLISFSETNHHITLHIEKNNHLKTPNSATQIYHDGTNMPFGNLF